MNNTCEELIKQIQKLPHYKEGEGGVYRDDEYGDLVVESDVIDVITNYRPPVRVG